MEIIFSAVIVISMVGLLTLLVRYVYRQVDNAVCATLVACCNDMLEQIAQEPDVIWLSTMMQRQGNRKTATLSIGTKRH